MRSLAIGVVSVLVSMILVQESRSSPNLIALAKVEFEDCGSQFELLKLTLSTCNSIPCSVEGGNFVTLTAEFDASNSPYSTNLMKHEAFWIVDNIQQSAIVLPNSCETSVNCPRTTTGGLLEFTSEIFVSSSLPKLSGIFHFKSKNAYGDTLMCYKVPINIY